MPVIVRHALDFLASQKSHRDTLLAALFDDALLAEVVPLFRYSYPLESAASRLQGFRHRVDSKDYVHGLLSLLLVAAQV